MNFLTDNNKYEVIYFHRNDGKFNIYVQKTSLLTNEFKGEATYFVGATEKIQLEIKDIINLNYE